MPIHPTAIVHPTAEVDPTAEIGPYACVGEHSCLGPNVRIYAHGYISDYTTLAAGVQVHPFAVVGHLPQDLKFANEPTYCEVGADCVIREHATVHRGTAPGSKTTVGERVFIMSTGHIGHNCHVGHDAVIANGGLLAGHVELGHHAFVAGNVGVHQFVRIGEYVMVGGRAPGVVKDIPPFVTVDAPGPATVNIIGLRRNGFTPDEIREIRHCHRVVYRSGLLLKNAIAQLRDEVQTTPGRRFVEFLTSPSKRGFAPLHRGLRHSDPADDES